METKISAMMQESADKTKELKGNYLSNNWTEACALGCLMISLAARGYESKKLLKHEGKFPPPWPQEIRDSLNSLVETSALSEEAQEYLRERHPSHFQATISLETLVANLNDGFGRDYAIQFVKKLGF